MTLWLSILLQTILLGLCLVEAWIPLSSSRPRAPGAQNAKPRKQTRFNNPQGPRRERHIQLANDLDPFVDEYPQKFDAENLNILWDSVVRIYCTHSEPDMTMPWQKERQYSSTASGFVIRIPGLGFRIMTNAHAVEYGSIIQVRRRGGDAKIEAEVEFIGNECDLAVLHLVDPIQDSDFFTGLEPLSFGSLPELQDEVDVLGYPIGGESMSVTSGVVSRVEMQEYSQAGFSLLALQIDAAINPGNSGGPVVNEELECVGVAFQSLDGTDVENIGYVVPVTVVEHFLEDIARNGRYTGWCSLGIGFQLLENKGFRDYLGMRPEHTGVMLTSAPLLPSPARATLPPSKAEEEAEVEEEGGGQGLRLDDVLLSVDGITIANDGTIPFRRGERVALSSYVSSRFAGDELNARVWRKKKQEPEESPASSSSSSSSSVLSPSSPECEEVALKLRLRVANAVVPHHWDNGAPPYLVCGGLVFTCLSVPYLRAEGAFDRFHTSELAYLAHLAAHCSDGQQQPQVSAGSSSSSRSSKSSTQRRRTWNHKASSRPAATDPKALPPVPAAPSSLEGSTVVPEEVVVLSLVLAHRVNLGYEHLENQHLVRFNGTPVRSLAHLAEMLESAMGHEQGQKVQEDAEADSKSSRRREDGGGREGPSFLRFEFAPQGHVVVLESSSARAATSEVCAINGVPAFSHLPRSPDCH